MKELTQELDKYIDLYSSELENIDCSTYEDYEFSKDYKDKMSQIMDSVKNEHKPRFKFTFKRALLIASVAILLTCSIIANLVIVNSTKSNEWQTSAFNIVEYKDHSEIYAKPNGEYKSKIEYEFSVDASDKYYLAEEESTKTNKYITKTYYSKNDKSKWLIFSQYTDQTFFIKIDNEYSNKHIQEKKDKHNNSILVFKDKNDNQIIAWSNNEYTFQLSASMTEDELMDIYYSVK